MYSGITQGLFSVIYVQRQPGLITYGLTLNAALLQGLVPGASLAVDGVCQTVVSINHDEVTLQAMQATLEITTLDQLHIGRQVSVERSLRYGDEIGGHTLSGHIAGTATVQQHISKASHTTLVLQVDPTWMKYIFPKGFIALDGSSLTVAHTQTADSLFTVHCTPETLRRTLFGQKNKGDRINVEWDHITQTLVDTTERILPSLLKTQSTLK